MRIFYVEVQYSFGISDTLQPTLHTSTILHGPNGIFGPVDHPRIGIACVDNNLPANPKSVKISKKKTTPKEKAQGYLKFLHGNEEGMVDRDWNLVVLMEFCEHQEKANYIGRLKCESIIEMLNVPQKDIVTLGYSSNKDYIYFILFVMRKGHRTKGILQGTEYLRNESGQLRIEKSD